MYLKTTLDNGLRILITNMPHTRSVSLALFVGVGSRCETDAQAGASHFIEHMVFKGTEKRPSAREIATAIEGVGGVFNATTSREVTAYWAKVAAPHRSVAIDVVVDMLRHARFDPAEIEKERRVIIEEINNTLDTPNQLVHLLIDQLSWPDHPLGRDIAGTRESVRALDCQSLLDYMRHYYVPGNVVISLAGQVEHQAVVDELALLLGDWADGERRGFLPAMDNQTEPRLRVHYKDTEQAQLCLSAPGLRRLHPDRFVLRVLNTILGEGMSSRLFLEIREKRGLAYSVSSYLGTLEDVGVVGVYAGVDPVRIQEAIRAILTEWDRLRQEPVLEEELNKAREYFKGRLLLQMEDTFSVAAWFGRQELLAPDAVLTADQVVEELDKVTVEDVQRLAQQIFVGEKLSLAVVGPFEKEDEFRESLRFRSDSVLIPPE
jgi:predicted Zn-dependent peptidase